MGCLNAVMLTCTMSRSFHSFQRTDSPDGGRIRMCRRVCLICMSHAGGISIIQWRGQTRAHRNDACGMTMEQDEASLLE